MPTWRRQSERAPVPSHLSGVRLYTICQSTHETTQKIKVTCGQSAVTERTRSQERTMRKIVVAARRWSVKLAQHAKHVP